MSQTRAQIERTADRIRAELLDTLEELERRRARALDLRLQLAEHTGAAIAFGVGTLAATVGLLFVSRWRARRRRRVLPAQRLKAVLRAWQHPNRVAAYPRRRYRAELGRKVSLAFASALAAQAARRGARSLLSSPNG